MFLYNYEMLLFNIIIPAFSPKIHEKMDLINDYFIIYAYQRHLPATTFLLIFNFEVEKRKQEGKFKQNKKLIAA